MKIAFYGNHAQGYDRIPEQYNTMVPSECFRSDEPMALSPYWKGQVLCEVPDGCDFTVHPPILQEGFQVLSIQERSHQPARGLVAGRKSYKT